MQRGVEAEDIKLYVAETQTKGTASVTFPIYITAPEPMQAPSYPSLPAPTGPDRSRGCR